MGETGELLAGVFARMDNPEDVSVIVNVLEQLDIKTFDDLFAHSAEDFSALGAKIAVIDAIERFQKAKAGELIESYVGKCSQDDSASVETPDDPSCVIPNLRRGVRQRFLMFILDNVDKRMVGEAMTVFDKVGAENDDDLLRHCSIWSLDEAGASEALIAEIVRLINNRFNEQLPIEEQYPPGSIDDLPTLDALEAMLNSAQGDRQL